MAIEKYGRGVCGYGTYIQQAYESPHFDTSITVKAMSTLTGENFAKGSFSPKALDGISLYVVFDGETKKWREYFTGFIVKGSPTHKYGVDIIDADYYSYAHGNKLYAGGKRPNRIYNSRYPKRKYIKPTPHR